MEKHQALPNLQSLIIVMLKTTLVNVQAIAQQNGDLNAAAPEANIQGNLPKTKSSMSLSQSNPASGMDASISDEDLDNIRLREVAHKAISGALILMLKWFKLSRKFLCYSSCPQVAN